MNDIKVIKGNSGECRIQDCLIGMKNIPDKFFDLCLTDIPYNQKVQHKNGKIGGDNKSYSSIKTFESKVFPITNDNPFTLEQLNEIFRISKNQVIFGGNYYPFFPFTKCWYIWDKRTNNKEKSDHADGELAWTSFDTSVRIFHYLWNGFLQQDMKNKEKRYHPFQKPVKLWEWIIEKCQPKSIIDPCCGSCVTGEVCENLGINYLCFEIMSEYSTIIEKRIKDGIRKHNQNNLNKYINIS